MSEEQISRIQEDLIKARNDRRESSTDVMKAVRALCSVCQQMDAILPLALASKEMQGEKKSRRLRNMNDPQDHYQHLWRVLQEELDATIKVYETYKFHILKIQSCHRQIAWIKQLDEQIKLWAGADL